MIRVQVRDEKNYLLLTAGYAPSTVECKLLLRRYAPMIRSDLYDVSKPDELLATVLSAAARNAVLRYRLHADSNSIAAALPVCTWVLGRPLHESAMFADWFADEMISTSYRILIHRTPRYCADGWIPPLWSWIYWRSNSDQIVTPASFRPNKRQKQRAGECLCHLLRHYQVDQESVNSEIDLLGHPVSSSDASSGAKEPDG